MRRGWRISFLCPGSHRFREHQQAVARLVQGHSPDADQQEGISALQIMRYMGFGSYKTALYMCNRVRAALSEHKTDKLAGVVEVDETYIGGKVHNKYWDKHDGGTGGAGSGKTTVIGAISRKGNVVLRVIENTDTATLNGFVNEAVSNKVSLICTDEHPVIGSLVRGSSTASCGTARRNMSLVPFTRTQSKAFGRSSGAALSAPSTRLAANTCLCTLLNFNSVTTSATTPTFSVLR
jgi:ISXO2-like transposase domain